MIEPCPRTLELYPPPRVLGLDPGFASLGWAVLDLGAPRILGLGVLRTQKESAKARLLAIEDNGRRCRELYRGLVEIIDAYRPGVIAAEAMSFPRSASVAAKVAMVWGLLFAVTEARGLPLQQATPQQVKRWATGSRSCSKDDVAFEVRRRCTNGNASEALLDGVPSGLHEHAWDAAAVALACADSDVVRAMRGAA